MKINIFFLIFLLSQTISHLASADWKKVRSGEQSEFLLSVSPISGVEVFFSGFTMDTSSMFPKISSRIYYSQNGGTTLNSIAGNLAITSLEAIVNNIFFKDSMNGWVTISKGIYRTNNRGGSWVGTKVSDSVSAVHFFDLSTGIAIGDNGMILRSEDGGKTWNKIESPSSVPLSCMFWIDSSRGFIAGTASKTEGDPGNEVTTYSDGILLITNDGGKTWKQGYKTTGVILCPIFFLSDGKTGWLGSSVKQSEDQSTAHLLKTSDGGISFTDMNVNVSIGEVVFLMKMPVNASYFSAMFWEDENRGHIGGSAFIINTSSSQGGQQPIYRNADFMTKDGGKTWKKTDLGQIKIDMTGGSMPQGDGRITGGGMRSLYDGWMAGEFGSVYKYEFKCSIDEDCGAGYECEGDSSCKKTSTGQDACTGSSCLPDLPPDTDVKGIDMAQFEKISADGALSQDCGGKCPSTKGGGCSMASSSVFFMPVFFILIFAFILFTALKCRGSNF
jgi:photosystem II stability/assembly factor-like uncharacterized protein